MAELSQSGDRELSDLKMLQMSDRILKSAITIGGWRWSRTAQRASDLETVEYTQALLNFGYEVVKVNPTVDATNTTEVSTWIETLLEGGDLKLAAAGMNDFLSGAIGRTEKIKTLEYGGKLLKGVNAVSNSSIRNIMQNVDFTQDLINMGAAYSTLRNVYTTSSSTFYAEQIWNSSDTTLAANVLTSYFGELFSDTEATLAIQSNNQMIGEIQSFGNSSVANASLISQRAALSINKIARAYGRFKRVAWRGSDDPNSRVKDQFLTLVKYDGSLFIQGNSNQSDIWFSDVRQGLLGDCYLMAAMAAAALWNPNAIRTSFTNKGSGLYSVKFRDFPFDRSVDVDTDLPCNDPYSNNLELIYAKSSNISSDGIELWVPLMEKAYAMVYGGGTYEGIQNGAAGNAYRHITGEVLGFAQYHAWSANEDELFQYIKSKKGGPVIIGTSEYDKSKSANAGLPVGNHAYVLLGVDSSTHEIVVYNPWGTVEKFTSSQFLKTNPYIYA